MGPTEQGPMTGRGGGWCGGANASDPETGRGRGRGFRGGLGAGPHGWLHRNRYKATGLFGRQRAARDTTTVEAPNVDASIQTHLVLSDTTAAKPISAKNTVPRMVAVVAVEKCTACGICVDLCPRGAVTVDDVAAVDVHLCTGCGFCIDGCARGAVSIAKRAVAMC